MSTKTIIICPKCQRPVAHTTRYSGTRHRCPQDPGGTSQPPLGEVPALQAGPVKELFRPQG